MRRLAFIALILTTAGQAYGQITSVIGGTSLPAVISSVMPYVASGTTAVDRNGNLYIFDVTYTYPTSFDGPLGRFTRVPPAIKTRITIISSVGTVMKTETLDGHYQLLGAGEHAVYAALTAYTTGATVTVTRKLIAFVGTGQVETAISLTGDARLNPSFDNRPDVISVLDYALMPMLAVPANTTVPARQRQGQLIRFSGGAFDVKTFVIPN